MDKKTIVSKIGELKSKKTDRKFTQSMEISVNFKEIDLESSEFKLNLNIPLPKGRGRDVDIGVFADGDMNVRAKKLSKFVLNKDELEKYSKDKRKMRKFASSCYAFIAQPDLMATVGKSWGIVLGPKGKMPQPVPPNADLAPVIDRIKNSVRIRSKKNPTIHALVGTENMSPDDLADNTLAILSGIERQIPKDKIKSIYLKYTMSEPVELM